MTTNQLWAVAGVWSVCWAGLLAGADNAACAAQPAKKPLIFIQVPDWTGDDHNWGGPYDGPAARRMCLKILRDEAGKLEVELTSDPNHLDRCDGALSLSPQSPKTDVPTVDVLFQGHRVFFDAFGTIGGQKDWDLKRKHYLLASTNDPQWLRTGLRLLKAVWQVRNARVCVVTEEANAADSSHPQLGTTFHPVPPARLEEAIRKVNDQEAAAVAADYMHQGRMDGTVEGTSGYQKMQGEKWYVVDPALAEKAKQEVTALAKFYLGCRNLLAQENCQALTLANPAKYGATPVLAFSGLVDEGIAASFDRDATLVLLMAGALLQRAGFVHGPLATKGDHLFVATSFTCPTRLDGYDVEPPTSFSLGVGAGGKGLGIQSRWRKGDVITRLQLKESALLVGRGRVRYSDINPKEGHRTAIALALEDEAAGPRPDASNAVIVWGDCANEMCCLARLLDLEFPSLPGVLVPK